MIKPATFTTALPIASIRELERRGLELGLPLMQRAGSAAAQFLNDHIPNNAHVLVLVGPGNNGGDALVTALTLKRLGHRLTVVMPQASPNAPSDAKQALMQWLVAGGQVLQHLPASKPDAIVDGLFGIGLSRSLENPWSEVIKTINSWQVPTLALDIPSGLQADSGQRSDEVVQATWTLSFIAPSLATVSEHGSPFCGECFVEDLDLDLNPAAMDQTQQSPP